MSGRDPSYAANRRPENRRIYAEQQIDWFYTRLIMACKSAIICQPQDVPYWVVQCASAERDLADVHERHLKACAELGPAKVYVRRFAFRDYEYLLRDAAGFIRNTDHGYTTRMDAAVHGHQAARNLGMEVE